MSANRIGSSIIPGSIIPSVTEEDVLSRTEEIGIEAESGPPVNRRLRYGVMEKDDVEDNASGNQVIVRNGPGRPRGRKNKSRGKGKRSGSHYHDEQCVILARCWIEQS